MSPFRSTATCGCYFSVVCESRWQSRCNLEPQRVLLEENKQNAMQTHFWMQISKYWFKICSIVFYKASICRSNWILLYNTNEPLFNCQVFTQGFGGMLWVEGDVHVIQLTNQVIPNELMHAKYANDRLEMGNISCQHQILNKSQTLYHIKSQWAVNSVLTFPRCLQAAASVSPRLTLGLGPQLPVPVVDIFTKQTGNWM